MDYIKTLQGITGRATLYQECKTLMDAGRKHHLLQFEVGVAYRLWRTGEVTRELPEPEIQPMWLGEPELDHWRPLRVYTVGDNVEFKHLHYIRLPGIPRCNLTLRATDGYYYEVLTLSSVLVVQYNIVEANLV